MTVGTSKTIVCRVSMQVGHREEVMLQVEAEGSLAAEFLPFGRTSAFSSVGLQPDGMKPTHFMGSNLLSSEATDLNVNLI